MKALMLSEYRQLDYIDYPVPEPGPEDVLIQVKTAGFAAAISTGMMAAAAGGSHR